MRWTTNSRRMRDTILRFGDAGGGAQKLIILPMGRELAFLIRLSRINTATGSPIVGRNQVAPGPRANTGGR